MAVEKAEREYVTVCTLLVMKYTMNDCPFSVMEFGVQISGLAKRGCCAQLLRSQVELHPLAVYNALFIATLRKYMKYVEEEPENSHAFNVIGFGWMTCVAVQLASNQPPSI